MKRDENYGIDKEERGVCVRGDKNGKYEPNNKMSKRKKHKSMKWNSKMISRYWSTDWYTHGHTHSQFHRHTLKAVIAKVKYIV